MAVALYRKYRPHEFDEMVGQEYIVKAISNALKYDKLSHAYLFTGPRGVGKTSMARLISKSINGVDEESIQEIVEGRHIDVIEIDAASNRGVDEIRNIRDNIKYLPLKGRKKIYIIDEVHMLTNEAFNALLKTLEEPPKHALFILATTEIEKIPATVISRCQRYDFTPISAKQSIELLRTISEKEQIDIDDESLEMIYEKSEGSVRDMFSIYEKLIDSFYNEKITSDKTEVILGFIPTKYFDEFLEKINNNDIDKLLEYSNELWKMGINIEKFLKGFSKYLTKYDSKYVSIIYTIYDNIFKFRFEEDNRLLIYLIIKDIFNTNIPVVNEVKYVPTVIDKPKEIKNSKDMVEKLLTHMRNEGQLPIYTALFKSKIEITENTIIITQEQESRFIYETIKHNIENIKNIAKEVLEHEYEIKLQKEKTYEIDETAVQLAQLFKGSIK